MNIIHVICRHDFKRVFVVCLLSIAYDDVRKNSIYANSEEFNVTRT